jgi:predicted acetyltransferase
MSRVAVPVPGVSVEIVTPGEERRDEVAHLLATTLNFPVDRATAMAPSFPLDDMRVAIDDGRIVACAGDYPFDQWFGGRPVACSGVWGVATLPERRTSGLASACVDPLLARARERGWPITALYPAVLRPYRRLGYEVAGTFTRHRLATGALAAGRGDDLPPVEVADLERDLPEIQAAYRAWIRDANGPVEPLDDEHWRWRVLDRPFDDSFRAVVVRESGRITGVAAFSRLSDPGPLDIAFGLNCSALFALDLRAWRALLRYFHGYRGVGKWLQWVGSPTDPIALLVPDEMVHTEFRYDWMLRILDVPGAFEARGYADIDAEAVIAVEDPRWPENAGPWRIEVRAGSAKVTPTKDASPRPIPVGMLSSMFTGFLRVPDAVRLGVLDPDDPSLEDLAAMLDGPDPWCPFFF